MGDRCQCAWYAAIGEGLQPALLRLAEALLRVDDFFGSLGGLPWYQLRCLRFIADAAAQRETDAAASSGSILADRRASSDGAHSSHSGAVNTLDGSARADADISSARSGIDGSAGTGADFSSSAAAGADDERFHMPCGVDLERNPQAARRAAAQGLQALPYMAEIYPIGGEAIASFATQRAFGHWKMRRTTAQI